MRSSSGEYYVALDHVRAVAAFLVFAWHFMHQAGGVPLAGAPAVFPLAILDEGHTGVSLFMTLSGYLFAKLLADQAVDMKQFLFNRALRLVPLLLVFLAISLLHVVLSGGDVPGFLLGVVGGAVLPTLPGGAWSLTVELHFYVLLPTLLVLLRRWPYAPLLIVAVMLLLRLTLAQIPGWPVQVIGYLTIVGHLDQFLLGMFAWRFRHLVTGRHLVIAIAALAFSGYYWWFDATGGFYGTETSRIWVVMPAIEGAFYAAAIAWYDSSFRLTGRSLASRVLALLGKYSYSIYLLHGFVIGLVFPRLLGLLPLSNFYVATATAIVCFPLLMLPIGHLSYIAIERPFLRLRGRYLRRPGATPAQLQPQLAA